MFDKVYSSLSIVILLVLLNGCDFYRAHQDQKMQHRFGVISGHIRNENIANSIIILRQVSTKKIYDAYLLPTSGEYLFIAPSGDYYIEVFIDKNRDYFHQTDSEASTRGEIITLHSGSNIIVPELIPHDNDYINTDGLRQVLNKGNKNDNIIGYTIDTVLDLDDVAFTPENGHKGLWTPIHFLKEIKPGIYFTETPRTDRIPVLFIHGINGTPADFRVLADSIDRTKFQACFLFYPSGFHLSTISAYTLRWLNALQAKYNYKDIVIVAHSMGGLIAKSTIDRLVHQSHDSEKSLNVLAFLTYSTPWNGLKVAAIGVEYSPVVLESWRDIALGSEYLTQLHRERIPLDIPFTLVFSYKDDYNMQNSGDGTIPLSSQLQMDMQRQAIKLIGINADHDGILSDTVAIDTLHTVLSAATNKNRTKH